MGLLDAESVKSVIGRQSPGGMHLVWLPVRL